MTARRRNEAMEKIGQAPEGWRPDPIPEQLRHIWGWYLEVHRWRGVDKGKPRPLDWTAIQAWQAATGRSLGPFELDVFAMLEQTFLSIAFSTDETAEPVAPSDVAKRMKEGLRQMADNKRMRTINVAPKK